MRRPTTQLPLSLSALLSGLALLALCLPSVALASPERERAARARARAQAAPARPSPRARRVHRPPPSGHVRVAYGTAPKETRRAPMRTRAERRAERPRESRYYLQLNTGAGFSFLSDAQPPQMRPGVGFALDTGLKLSPNIYASVGTSFNTLALPESRRYNAAPDPATNQPHDRTVTGALMHLTGGLRFVFQLSPYWLSSGRAAIGTAFLTGNLDRSYVLDTFTGLASELSWGVSYRLTRHTALGLDLAWRHYGIDAYTEDGYIERAQSLGLNMSLTFL